ncbi:MAG: DTW domain-containing protein [Proteobacteria bacterium]|nr:DTW domain-containing protein [Pseudomonadota bacterium]
MCGLIASFSAHVNTLVLQHPNERRKYYSTAKLLSTAVTNCTVMRGVEFDPEHLARITAGQNCYLLYPSREARDCSEVPLSNQETIIVVDGTWREAAKIVFRNPFLQSLPRLSFKEELQSRYRIRKQPKQGCLSTIESVAHLLKRNALVSGAAESVPRYDSLLEGFERMIAQQVAFWPTRN